MAAARSFQEYIKNDNFTYNEIVNAIDKFTNEHFHQLDLRCRRIRTPGEVEVYDYAIRWLDIENYPGMEIKFTIVTDVTFFVTERNHHDDYTEECHQWLCICCRGDLAKELRDLKVLDISVYDKRKKLDNPMTDALVPIIKREDYDRIAENLLKNYYPEVLEKPLPSNPMLLAEKLGLKVVVRRIKKDGSVFGQICFYDTDIELYNIEQDRYEKEHVPAGTILVDFDSCFLRNLGSVNMTIFHECVHWCLHRKVFLLERLYNKNITKIECMIDGDASADGNVTSVKQMEIQANMLAPRLLMPLKPFKRKVAEILNRMIGGNPSIKPIDVMEVLIDELAIFYCVSREAAKIRMVEAGYEEAIGVFNYIDGHYAAPHCFKKGSITRMQTFCIGAADAGILYYQDENFRKEIDSGKYLYVDSHFVLNSPDYIRTNEDGYSELTRYARLNMESCCLVFDIQVRGNAGYGNNYQSICVLNRDIKTPFEFELKLHGGYENSSSKAKQNAYIEKVLQEQAEIYRKLSNDFTACLKIVKEWRKMTYLDISEEMFISEDQLKKIFSGASDTTIETLVALCLVLHLPPEISFHIIDRSSCQLKNTDQKHLWYRQALLYKYGCSLKDIRAYLREHDASIF